jgi:DNA-binding transcriptional LysR family regulator
MKSDFRDWSDVRVFLAVVRAGSTLAASKTLGMAQPTVARRIDALEHALGLVLFERDTRGFQPTPEAQALIEEAEALEGAARIFSDKARRLIAGKSRTIRITAFYDAFSGRMPTVLEEFIRLHPEVQFEFLASDAYLDVAAGDADVAIRVADKIGDASLICRKIRDIRLSLFASKAYAEKHPLPSSEAELGGHKFIVLQGLRANRASQIWLRERIDPGQIVMEVDGLAAAEAAVMMGAGLAISTTRIGGGNDTFIQCFELPPETFFSSWFLVNPAAYRRPEVKAFAAFFVPRYRAMFPQS